MPRPSSPVHAKAFTRCHQRQHWKMIKCLDVVRYGMVIKLSQIIILVYDLSIDPHPSSLAAKRHKNQSHVATASIKKPIHNVKERHASAQRISPDVSGKPFLFIPRVYGEQLLPGTLTNQRFARPNGRRRLCGGHPNKSHLRSKWWSLSGSNR